MKTLVIAFAKDCTNPPYLFREDILVGWRIILKNGEPYDTFWGRCVPEKLESLVNDIQSREVIDILDLRERPTEIHDKGFYSRDLPNDYRLW